MHAPVLCQAFLWKLYKKKTNIINQLIVKRTAIKIFSGNTYSQNANQEEVPGKLNTVSAKTQKTQLNKIHVLKGFLAETMRLLHWVRGCTKHLQYHRSDSGYPLVCMVLKKPRGSSVSSFLQFFQSFIIFCACFVRTASISFWQRTPPLTSFLIHGEIRLRTRVPLKKEDKKGRVLQISSWNQVTILNS